MRRSTSGKFNPLANDGGAPVTFYTAQCAGMPTAFNTGTVSQIVVTGMINGQSHTCGVIAPTQSGEQHAVRLDFGDAQYRMPLALTGGTRARRTSVRRRSICPSTTPCKPRAR